MRAGKKVALVIDVHIDLILILCKGRRKSVVAADGQFFFDPSQLKVHNRHTSHYQPDNLFRTSARQPCYSAALSCAGYGHESGDFMAERQDCCIRLCATSKPRTGRRAIRLVLKYCPSFGQFILDVSMAGI